MEPPPQWRRWATSDWVALAAERRAADAERDRVLVDLEPVDRVPVRLELVGRVPVRLELLRLELLRLELEAPEPQHVGLGRAEGERVAAARCLARLTRSVR